ncbi:hypothetical protein [Embleya hyalina]|uniref:Uncharacterized protein n=1 Tax=Embleya hyalina TaxID=516124 RepID=A0A401YHK9_9ACTN|nr:hypothetical protein [Embleya hyalina]GCD94091.1 hypothetical protein EHYA_01748 [Embleya hyalina]
MGALRRLIRGYTAFGRACAVPVVASGVPLRVGRRAAGDRPPEVRETPVGTV